MLTLELFSSSSSSGFENQPMVKKTAAVTRHAEPKITKGFVATIVFVALFDEMKLMFAQGRGSLFVQREMSLYRRDERTSLRRLLLRWSVFSVRYSLHNLFFERETISRICSIMQ